MVKDLFNLDGKVAIVTGASRGLGQGMAIALAQAGANVVGVGQSDMTSTKAEINKVGREFFEIKADLTTTEKVDEIVRKTVEEFGRVDILVNNAGTMNGQNINVNAIAPGYMATDNTKAIRGDDKRNLEILERIPAGRWGTPEDLAGAVVFLASKASDYVNGYTLAVDGGWLAR